MFSRLLGFINPFNKPVSVAGLPVSSVLESVPQMVQTRRQSGNKIVAEFDNDGEAVVEGVDRDDVPAELLGPESRKRRREKVKEERGQGDKRRKLPVRSKDSEEMTEGESHVHWEQEMRLSELPGHKTDDDEQPEMDRKGIEKAGQDEQESTPDTEIVKGSVSRMQKSDSKTSQSASKASETPISVPIKPKHKKFSDDTADDFPIPPDPESIAIVQDFEEEEVSDDDAPEEVGQQDAQQKVREAERDASKAAELQASLARQKRKILDAKLKAQAASKTKTQSSSKKRKLDIEDEEEDKFPNVIPNPNPARLKINRSNLPEFLPAEYLEDAAPTDEAKAPVPQPTSKKIKFGEFERSRKERKEKGAKDVIKNGTTYRVAERNNALLPPKADQRAKSLKDLWLKGRSGGKAGGGGGGERKKVGGGFLVR